MKSDTLDYFSLGHPLTRLRSHYALRARRRMMALFMEASSPSSTDSVLDLGVTPDTSLSESNFFEALYPYPERITAASIEDASNLEVSFPGVRFARLEGGPLPFADKQFDLLFCSAVLEHVGTRAQQQEFVREALRVSKRFFFTTPNRWYPLEFHTLLPLIHWLPQPLHQRMLRAMGRTFLADTNNLNLLDAGSLLAMFPPGSEAALHRIRLLGMTSNLVVSGTSGLSRRDSSGFF